MSRKFVAHPAEGVPGVIEDDGRQVQGFVRIHGEIYEPGEEPSRHAKTLAAWKQQWLDPSTGALRIRFGASVFVIGPDVIGGLPDSTYVRIGISHHPYPSASTR